MTIHVTQADIDEGEACNCYRCPIALAIRRAHSPRIHIAVNPSTAEIRDKRFDLPVEVADFICWFDNCDPHSQPKGPFSFILK